MIYKMFGGLLLSTTSSHKLDPLTLLSTYSPLLSDIFNADDRIVVFGTRDHDVNL